MSNKPISDLRRRMTADMTIRSFSDKTPTFEFNREQSLASRAAIEAFVKQSKAQLWIEHDLATFNKLKKSPQFYE